MIVNYIPPPKKTDMAMEKNQGNLKMYLLFKQLKDVFFQLVKLFEFLGMKQPPTATTCFHLGRPDRNTKNTHHWKCVPDPIVVQVVHDHPG